MAIQTVVAGCKGELPHRFFDSFEKWRFWSYKVAMTTHGRAD
jgi:hypothetical protein